MTPIMKRWARVYVFQNEESGAESGGGSSAAPAAPVAEQKTQFGSAHEAVAELDRREEARRAERKAAKVAAPQPEPKAEATAPEAEIDADEEPADDHDLDAEFDDDDAEDGADVATEDEAEDDAATLTTISIDGKEMEIPKGTPKALVERVQAMASELKSDYTRKTQEVAQERQTVHAAWSQAQQTTQQLQQAQAALLQFAESTIGAPPDLSLAQTDPQSYLVQRGLHEQRYAQLQGLMQQGQAIAAQQQAAQAQQRTVKLQEGMRKLVEHMPELREPAKRQEFAASAANVGAQYGFSAQEIDAIDDPRMILALRDLAKAQQAAKTRQVSTQSVKAKLTNVPPKTARASASAGQPASRGQEAKAQFLRSGRTQKDLQRYLRSTES